MKPLVAVPMPVHGRRTLLPWTIKRLLRQAQDQLQVVVVCIGAATDRLLCESAGALFYEHANEPLGAKWQHGFDRCRDLQPDAVLYAGSSDWFSDGYLMEAWTQTTNIVARPTSITGVKEITFVDIGADGYRSYYWPGYPPDTDRREETIGAGRLLRRSALDAADWHVFDGRLTSSLDHSMERNVGHAEPFTPQMSSVISISTFAWGNRHDFYKGSQLSHVHSKNAIDTKHLLTTQFPDLLRVFPEVPEAYHGM